MVLMAGNVTNVSCLRANVHIQEPKLSWRMAAPLTHPMRWVPDSKLFLQIIVNVPTVVRVLLLLRVLSPFFHGGHINIS